ncbi:LacI family DNA-binding transcriptional regulator [Thalassococcus sp. S3]|uniref:LacI family DNA-binding transcriptional regulator n=1 Tax=Thalassococcus sp. S3 TaxID=2017482 RepID=UPI0010242CAD|nr:LacI family DNA-binding transcriptional regulator [Thalassococcus sp. S3]QBF30904.1 LacI family transcriptional regulator [Thalassococcus sp. S3]
MLKKKRANLRDVARMSGVSVATVSRVLNAPKAVSEPTRERVQAAMTELKFMPSAAARAINSGRSRMVGALVPTLDHAIFARFLEALEQRLAELGQSLVVSTTGGDPEVEAAKARELLDVGAEGLIVSGISQSGAFLERMEATDVPVVATSYFAPGHLFPTVGYDNRAVARTALAHLTGLGHREIAVVHGPVARNDRTAERLAALRESQARLRFSEARLGVSGGTGAVEEILRARDGVSAILCLSDVQALGAMFELSRQGLAVPDDISLMGIDDLPWSRLSAPGLSTVRLPVQEMGARAAEALNGWIESHERPGALELKAELIVRGSTARFK